MTKNLAIKRQCKEPCFWLHGDAEKIYEAVQNRGGELRAVGGAIRDYLLLGCPADFGADREIDFACNLPPDILKLVAEDLSVEVRLHGQAYGMIMFIMGGNFYEVTSLRRDVRTFGRSAQVEFGGDWCSDAQRRDFTINALSMDSDACIYDYCGGFEDLGLAADGGIAPLLRFVGDADSRICEDYLRILRLFRFYSVIEGCSLDSGILEICSRHASSLLDLSVERRRDELLKLLLGGRYHRSLSMMSEGGILSALGLPSDLPIVGYDFCDRNEILNFHLLYWGCFGGGNIKDFCVEWRLDNVRVRLFSQVVKVRGLLLGVEDLDYLLHCYGVSILRLAFLLCVVDGKDFGADIWGRICCWHFKEFPLRGSDICDIFGVDGVLVGDYLDLGLRYWLANDRLLQKDDLLKYLLSISD